MGALSQQTFVPTLLFCLVLGACGYPPTVKEVLTTKDGQFWDMYARHYAGNNPRLPSIRYTYHLYANGTCLRYVNNRNGTMCLYDGGNMLLSHTWSAAENTLTMDDHPYPVVRVTSDSIFLKVAFAVGLERRVVPDTLVLIRTHRRPIESSAVCD
jgi:hypothetical protein